MNRLLYPSLLLVVFSLSSLFAQSWNTIGSGITHPQGLSAGPSAVTIDDNNLYVVISEGPNGRPLVQKWNGLNWSSLPEVPDGNFNVDDIAVIDSIIYLVGYNSSQLSQLQLYAFDGQSWALHTRNGFSGSAYSLFVHQSELFVGGAFMITLFADMLLKFDGQNFVSGVDSWGVIPLHFGNMVRYNGDLYAGIGVQTVTTEPNGIRMYDSVSNQWQDVVHYRKGVVSSINSFHLFTFQNKLFALEGHKLLYEVASDTLFFIDSVDHYLEDFVELQGTGYLLGGPGVSVFDGSTLTPFYAPQNLVGGAAYSGELCVFSKTQDSLNGADYNYAYRSNGKYSVVQGRVYNDLNEDCFFNQNEVALPSALIKLGAMAVSTNQDGQYSMALAPGTYQLDTLYTTSSVGKNYRLSCSVPLNLTVGNGQVISQDFPLSNPISTDVQVVFTGKTGWRARHGFLEAYQLDFNNAGNQTLSSGTAVLEVPTRLTLVTASPQPSSINGNIFSWDFLNLTPGASEKVNLILRIEIDSNTVGDTLKFNSFVNGVSTDADPADNGDTLVQIVSAAVDPNDKQASDSAILPGTQRIDYHIRFQNTGTDTAYKVSVVDTLDMSLPISYIIINSASHPYNLAVANNILIWEFENIMLPDSAADFNASQGFVRFSAGINPSLGVGDTIDNDAEIYFDYQDPVHTNHAKTAIVSNISLPEKEEKAILISVYPNPAVEEIHIRSNSSSTMKLRLFDMSGKVLATFLVKPQGELTYNINGLSTGVYFIKSGTEVYRLVIN